MACQIVAGAPGAGVLVAGPLGVGVRPGIAGVRWELAGVRSELAGERPGIAGVPEVRRLASQKSRAGTARVTAQ